MVIVHCLPPVVGVNVPRKSCTSLPLSYHQCTDALQTKPCREGSPPCRSLENQHDQDGDLHIIQACPAD